MKYKLRAECHIDVQRLIQKIGLQKIESYTVSIIYCCDVLLSIKTGLSIGQLRDACRQVVDGHVMLETVQFAKDYTGKRVAP